MVGHAEGGLRVSLLSQLPGCSWQMGTLARWSGWEAVWQNGSECGSDAHCLLQIPSSPFIAMSLGPGT